MIQITIKNKNDISILKHWTFMQGDTEIKPVYYLFNQIQNITVSAYSFNEHAFLSWDYKITN